MLFLRSYGFSVSRKAIEHLPTFEQFSGSKNARLFGGSVRRRETSVHWHRLTRRRSQPSSRPSVAAAGNSGATPDSSAKFPLDWDPLEDLTGLDLRTRKGASPPQERRKYEVGRPSAKEIQCPACGGQGYTLCPHCNSKNLETPCPHCSGKGFQDCPMCNGLRVVLDDSLDDSMRASGLNPRSPVQIAEDEAIESLTSSPKPKRKTRRVYGSPTPETRQKISRSLKDLEARTGSLSRRLRERHRDPVLRARTSAAIKRARSTDEARKRTSEKLREFFKSPENRLRQGRIMAGLPFKCTACGERGHRRHFCPKLGFSKKKPERSSRPYRCSNCGQVGHRRGNCPQLPDSSSLSALADSNLEKSAGQARRNPYRCGICRSLGHTKRSCPTLKRKKSRSCGVCGQVGHNRKTCPAAVTGNSS